MFVSENEKENKSRQRKEQKLKQFLKSSGGIPADSPARSDIIHQ